MTGHTEEDAYKYEGTEKLLEAWFFSEADESNGQADLQNLSRYAKSLKSFQVFKEPNRTSSGTGELRNCGRASHHKATQLRVKVRQDAMF